MKHAKLEISGAIKNKIELMISRLGKLETKSLYKLQCEINDATFRSFELLKGEYKIGIEGINKYHPPIPNETPDYYENITMKHKEIEKLFNKLEKLL